MTTEEAIKCLQDHIVKLCEHPVDNKETIIAIGEYAIPAMRAVNIASQHACAQLIERIQGFVLPKEEKGTENETL